MTWAAVAIGGGMALSAGSGILGSQSKNRAGRQARDYSAARMGEGLQRYGNVLYGEGYDPTKYSRPGQAPPRPTANSLLGRQGALADLYASRAGGVRGQFDEGMAGLDNLYASSEGMAQEFGRGGEALIDEETARALKAANQHSAASLAASGFGNSTAAANQFSQNALDSARMAAGQKIGVRGQALDRVLSVRGARAGARGAGISQRADLYGNTLNNEMGYRQQPIQTELMAAGSNIANPFLGVNTTQYYPGYSGAGTALSTAGNALGLYGGYQMGQGGGAGGRSIDPYEIQGSYNPGGQSGYGGLYQSNRPR